MPQGKGTYGSKVGRPPKKNTTKRAMMQKANERIYNSLKSKKIKKKK